MFGLRRFSRHDSPLQGKDNGMKMLEAAGAVTAAVAQLGKTGALNT